MFCTVGCNCTLSGGLCLPANLGISEMYTPTAKDAVIKYGKEEVTSSFFKEHMTAAAFMCYVSYNKFCGLLLFAKCEQSLHIFLQKHKNSTACQVLGNLCTLTVHDRDHPSCDIIFRLSRQDRNNPAPQLFFSDRQSSSITKEEDITTVYNLRKKEFKENRLNITVAQYSATGKLLEV